MKPTQWSRRVSHSFIPSLASMVGRPSVALRWRELFASDATIANHSRVRKTADCARCASIHCSLRWMEYEINPLDTRLYTLR